MSIGARHQWSDAMKNLRSEFPDEPEASKNLAEHVDDETAKRTFDEVQDPVSAETEDTRSALSDDIQSRMKPKGDEAKPLDDEG